MKVEPCPGTESIVDPPAHRLDVAPHHVHAHAAPGDLGDLLGGGEAGGEDQVVDVVVARLLAVFDQPFVARLGEDGVAVEAAPVVGHLDDDAAALVVGAQPDGAVGRLAGGAARLLALDAVVDGVADHVHQRVGDLLDHAPIHLGAFAAGFHADELAGAAREVAHHARHLLEHPAHRHHAHARADALQIAGDLGHLADVAAQARGEAAPEFGGVGDHGFDDDQLADERDQAVDPLQVDFDEFGEFGGRPRLLGAHRLGHLLGGGRALGHQLFTQPSAAVLLRRQRRGHRLRGDLVDLAQNLADLGPGRDPR